MYVRIIDKGECFSTTMEQVNGVYANRSEWEKYNFYPQNGMVGEVVKRTPSAYVICIMEGIYVPMSHKGIQEISYDEFITSQPQNVCVGMDERQRWINDELDRLNRYTGYNWENTNN